MVFFKILLGIILFFVIDYILAIFFIAFLGFGNKTEEDIILDDIEQAKYLARWKKEQENKKKLVKEM